jgi:methyl-accepting chemotaxis protein
VEAARAGEQGRGFAVVASEVRALAQRSAQAAQEIKGLIQTSVSRIERGAELVHTAGDTIGQTVQAVHDMRTMLDKIAREAHEQANGVSTVSQALVSLDSTMQQNASMVEQAAAASNSLKDQSRKLNQVVAFFQAA